MPVAVAPATRPSATVHTNLSYLVPICLVATLGGLLFGYDTGVISGAIEFLTARFHLDVVMKGWASGCVLIGCATGVLIVGPISDRFGRKRRCSWRRRFSWRSAIGTALPRDIWTFILFRWLGGIGIGIASMSTPMYIAEIAPAHLRGRLVSINQIAIVGGIVVVYFVNYLIARYGDQAWNETVGWRWMFASGILPSIAFALLLLRIPESPRWLVGMGRIRAGQDHPHQSCRRRLRPELSLPVSTRRYRRRGAIGPNCSRARCDSRWWWAFSLPCFSRSPASTSSFISAPPSSRT